LANQKNNFDKLFSNNDLKINQNLFNFEERINDKDEENLEKIVNSLSNINNRYKRVTGTNVIEFLTRLEFNNKASILGGNRKLSAKEMKLNLEEALQNSFGSMFLGSERERFLKYEDYRLIDAYIPEVAKCLTVYKDCIISPDDITKKALPYYFKDKVLDLNKHDDTLNKNLAELEKTYKLNKKIPVWIRESLLLGDLFIIIMDYNQAFERVLREDDDNKKDDIFVNNKKEEDPEIIKEDMLFEEHEIYDLLDLNETEMLNFGAKEKAKNEQDIKDLKKNIIDSINKNIKVYKDPKDLLSNDIKFMSSRRNSNSLNLNGSLLKVPNPENMIKIEIDDFCFGYIYIEKSQLEYGENIDSFRSTNNLNRSLTHNNNDVFNSRYDFLNNSNASLRDKYSVITDIFIRGISRKIDKKFINKNKDFKEAIYKLVKQDYILEKEISLTFIEPENVHHFKLDSDKTYGVSKLAKIIFFAKIYLAVLLTNLMQKVSRGRDKRAFYIDTGLDDDIEGAVQGVIKDIKSKEITTNSLSSITTLLNTVGAFDDYYIPTIDGEKPIEIDTVAGMDVEVDSDFPQYLLKSIISGMDIPGNYIDATMDVDFARSLSMQNSTFVRNIINYQGDFGEFFTEVIQHLYKNEFCKQNFAKNNKNKDLYETELDNANNISIKFPVPVYLNLTNINDQIGNASSTIDFLVSLYFPEGSTEENVEDLKTRFKQSIAKDYFLTTMEWDLFNKIYTDIIKNSNKDAINSSIKYSDEENGMDENNMESGEDEGSDEF